MLWVRFSGASEQSEEKLGKLFSLSVKASSKCSEREKGFILYKIHLSLKQQNKEIFQS
jgi:hypothetical protein